MLRAGLALLLTLALAPAMADVRAPDGFEFALLAACNAAIGAAIGVGASVLYDGAYAGGRALDDYVGIRGSAPNAGTFAPSGFGRIWSLVFTGGFFLLGAYRIVIWAFARSFEAVPANGLPAAHALYAFAITLPSAIVESALLVAAPSLALAFVTHLTLGALTRVIPRFASFTLSFPLVFGTVLAATLLCVPLLFESSGVPVLHLPFAMPR